MVVAILRQAGSFEAVLSAITEAEADWRDLLMATVLAPEDWPLFRSTDRSRAGCPARLRSVALIMHSALLEEWLDEAQASKDTLWPLPVLW